MIDFQAAERKRLEEPASEIGLEPLCAMVRLFLHRIHYIFMLASKLLLLLLDIENTCRLTTTCVAMILLWS